MFLDVIIFVLTTNIITVIKMVGDLSRFVLHLGLIDIRFMA